MTGEQVRVSAAWLDLREPADAAARSLDLVRILLACGPANSGARPGRGQWVDGPLARAPPARAAALGAS